MGPADTAIVYGPQHSIAVGRRGVRIFRFRVFRVLGASLSSVSGLSWSYC